MYYNDKYAYTPPPVYAPEVEQSQATVVFWGLILLVIFYIIYSAIVKRRNRIYQFFSGMLMPNVEFDYR